MLLLGPLTACAKAPRPGAARPSSGGATPTPSSAVPPAGDVARPGLLIDRDLPFTAAEVDRLRRVDGVTRVVLIGYGQVTVYDQPVATAAVDPATFRVFTPPGTVESAAVWDAVDAGKALVSHAVGIRDHLPLDATVPAGGGTVRIAGLATTVPGVDMVVSSAIGDRIGVPHDNGLVVAVSDRGRVVGRIRRVLGHKPAIRRIAGETSRLKLPPVGPPGPPGEQEPPGDLVPSGLVRGTGGAAG